MAALRGLLTHLAIDSPADADIGALLAVYNKAKSQIGRAGVGQALGLPEAELAGFDAALREMGRRVGRLAQDAGEDADRNAVIAQLRVYSWLETIAAHNPAFDAAPSLPPAATEDTARQQVRALELILRSLVDEHYRDQANLVARLRELLTDQVVDRWLAAADPDDVLSGTSFSELASLFVSKTEFENYRRLFEQSPFLTFLRDRRKTVQGFLEDVRRVRNVLAHNKRVTPTQLALLDLYYDELVAPVQEAHDHGETRVNPDEYLHASAEQLDAYFDALRQDVLSVKHDIDELREALQEQLGDIAEATAAVRVHTAGIRQDTGAIREAMVVAGRRLVQVGAGIGLLICVVGFLVYQNVGAAWQLLRVHQTATQTEQVAAATRDSVAEVERKVAEIAKPPEAKPWTREAIQAGYAALADSGLVAEPTAPHELYHNAQIYERRGDLLNARAMYQKLFALDLDLAFVDPHYGYQRLLKAQEGVVWANEVYAKMKAERTGIVTSFAWALLQAPAEQPALLVALLASSPKFAPALYELSLAYSAERLGVQSLRDKFGEQEALQAFLALHEAGRFERYYIDRAAAAAAVDEAETRLARLEALDPKLLETPVKMAAVRDGSDWLVTLSIAEPALEILYRSEPAVPFVSTGFSGSVDQLTGKPLPLATFQVPAGARLTLEVKYRDVRGVENGPFKLVFRGGAQLIAAPERASSDSDLLRTWIGAHAFIATPAGRHFVGGG